MTVCLTAGGNHGDRNRSARRFHDDIRVHSRRCSQHSCQSPPSLWLQYNNGNTVMSFMRMYTFIRTQIIYSIYSLKWKCNLVYQCTIFTPQCKLHTFRAFATRQIQNTIMNVFKIIHLHHFSISLALTQCPFRDIDFLMYTVPMQTYCSKFWSLSPADSQDYRHRNTTRGCSDRFVHTLRYPFCTHQCLKSARKLV